MKAMPRRCLHFVLWIAVLASLHVPAAAAERDIYYLGVALDQTGIRGGWQRVGEEGKWKGVIAGSVCKEKLYTVEKDGCLYVAKLDSGERKALGKAEFANTLFMFSSGDQLYTIEKNGCLYRVSPADASWGPVGENSVFKNIAAGAVLKGKLYTAETDGTLRVTDLASGKRSQIGKAEFKNLRALFPAGDKLGCIRSEERRVGKEGRSRWSP